MAQVAMYPLVAGGKETLLTADVTASDTTFYLEDLTNIPTAPNLITIKTSSALWERCRYTARVVTSGVAGYITVERSGAWHASSASGNAALSWGTGAKVLRAVSESDFTAIQGNISDHETRTSANASSITDHTSDILNPHLEPRKNLLINGGFSNWRRGTSFTSSTWRPNSDDVYIEDRWVLLSDGDNVVQIDRTNSGFGSSRYCSKHTIVTAAKKFARLQIIQASDVIPIRGKKVSLSFKAKTTSGKELNNLRCAILEWSGDADAVTSDVVSSWGAQGTTPTWATSWTVLNTPANLALSMSNQTFKVENVSVGSSANNLGVVIWLDDTDASVGDELYIGEFQFNLGIQATEFVYVDDISECSSRLTVFGGDGSIGQIFHVYGGSNGTTWVYIPVKWDMKLIPTLYTSGYAFVTGSIATGNNIDMYDFTNSRFVTLSGTLTTSLDSTSTKVSGVLRFKAGTSFNTTGGQIVQLRFGETAKIYLEAEL